VERYYWDDKIEYLQKTRLLYYNDDYLEFLVKGVWKVSEPVNVVDFGCGYGFLGLKLLPLLPEGSKYTGVDKGRDLIAMAESLFSDTPYLTEFHISDVDEFQQDAKFDIAVCHALLLHMSDPKKTLQRMKSSVKRNGLVICFEPFWLSAMSHTYVHDVPQSEIVKIGILQKLYEFDAKANGRDGNVGIKLPVYMCEIGLINVDCRVSDKVNHLDPRGSTSSRQALYDSLCEEGLSNVPQDEDSYVRNVTERGLSDSEARELFRSEVLAGNNFRDRGLEVDTLTAPTMMISYGTVSK